MKNLVFFLEGRSEKEFLREYLSKAFPIINDRAKFAEPVFITFEGKQGMDKRICDKLRGWNIPNSVFIILQDQDSSDCHVSKRQLFSKCTEAGKQSVSFVRIACRELENWYLGDLTAVGAAYSIDLKKFHNKSRFRNIDNLAGAQELRKITARKYEKIDGSRRIAKQFNSNYQHNRSHSFKVFCQCVESLISEESSQM